MRRACYLLGLLGCGLWYLLSGSWLGWILLLTLAILPWLSALEESCTRWERVGRKTSFTSPGTT